MIRLANGLLAALLILSASGLSGPSARADIILQQYEFQALPGTETSVAATNVAPGLSGLSFTESGVTPSAALNSINSTGWQNAGAYYQFGFTIQAGLSVTVDQLVLATRSSGTGPGSLNILASVDGGSFAKVAGLVQGNAAFNDQVLAISAVTASKSLTFRIVAANTTSAAGGTTAGTGTFRVGDYNPSGTPTPFTINGTIATLVAVPEPASIAMTGLGVLCASAFARRRQDARAR